MKSHEHRWLPPDFPCLDCGAPYVEKPDLKLPVRMLPDGTDWVPANRVDDVIERVRTRLHDLIEGDMDWEATLPLVDRLLDEERDR